MDLLLSVVVVTFFITGLLFTIHNNIKVYRETKIKDYCLQRLIYYGEKTKALHYSHQNVPSKYVEEPYIFTIHKDYEKSSQIPLTVYKVKGTYNNTDIASISVYTKTVGDCNELR